MTAHMCSIGLRSIELDGQVITIMQHYVPGTTPGQVESCDTDVFFLEFMFLVGLHLQLGRQMPCKGVTGPE